MWGYPDTSLDVKQITDVSHSYLQRGGLSSGPVLRWPACAVPKSLTKLSCLLVEQNNLIPQLKGRVPNSL